MSPDLEEFLAANGWREGLPADGSDPFARNAEIARERERAKRAERSRRAHANRKAKTEGQA